ncbi:hypothetical protein ART_3556 [Arthrobacter sp. PAMC 25486]|nr:hypothetical protein ART_0621 [Arthrobacter sp. PAMC 25486]AIY03115.1 hypothetical protein ART_3516 [Arthrobacter sp. PAMC 25486]AIY03155.1 hypothetical protein ART_3556 [Arthrobacter sp. PAMC 25486]
MVLVWHLGVTFWPLSCGAVVGDGSTPVTVVLVLALLG